MRRTACTTAQSDQLSCKFWKFRYQGLLHASVTEQTILRLTWSQTPKTDFFSCAEAYIRMPKEIARWCFLGEAINGFDLRSYFAENSLILCIRDSCVASWWELQAKWVTNSIKYFYKVFACSMHTRWKSNNLVIFNLANVLIHKAPPIICRRQFQILPL